MQSIATIANLTQDDPVTSGSGTLVVRLDTWTHDDRQFTHLQILGSKSDICV